jgi:hypothetical protein
MSNVNISFLASGKASEKCKHSDSIPKSSISQSGSLQPSTHEASLSTIHVAGMYLVMLMTRACKRNFFLSLWLMHQFVISIEREATHTSKSLKGREEEEN